MNPIPPPFPPPSPNPSRRSRRRWAAGAAAVVASGAIVAMPLAALAQDEDDGDGWLADVLQELVDDGTITSEQADAVEGAIQDARPERMAGGPGGFGHRGGWPLTLDEAAAALGIDADALREALRDGQSIADVAAEQGVELQTVIDALVAAAEERLDEAVAKGEIDAERAAARLASLRERITRLVEEDFPGRVGRLGRLGGLDRFDCDDESGGDAGPAAPGDEREDTEGTERTEDTTRDEPDDTTVTTEDTTPG